MGLERIKHKKWNTLTYNHALYFCVLLACLVPRGTTTSLKLHLGITISYYTVVVAFLWLVTTRRIVIKKRIECFFFFIWAAFIVISIWRAEKIGVWAFYCVWVLTAILLQQIMIRHQNEDTYYYITNALTDALFIHLLIGIYEVTTHTYLFETGNISRRLYGHVAISIFHNLNDYATFVTTIVPFAFLRFLNSYKVLERFFCVFLISVSLYMITVSESRGAFLTMLAFACGGIFMFARRSRKNKYITLITLLALVLVMGVNLGGVRSTFINYIISNSIDITNRSDISRINLIKNGLYFLKCTYGFGVGAGNLFEWLATRSIYPIGGLRYIHNWYAEVLVTFGVVFFILYLVFHGKLLYKLWSKKYENSQLKITMFLSLVCFSIVSISSSSNVYSEWVWMYLVVVSLFVVSLKKIK